MKIKYYLCSEKSESAPCRAKTGRKRLNLILYDVPAPDDKFQPAYYKNASGYDVCPFYEETFVYIYQSVLKNLDKAMPLEEAEQYFPQWSHEDQEWQMVKK